MLNNTYTIFLDVDGTILKHLPNFSEVCSIRTYEDCLKKLYLKGSELKTLEWHTKGYKIFLVTGRPETLRELTEMQLRHLSIFYDVLIMGCGNGPRVLINDMENGESKAISININRNEGISNVPI